ncbi:hypothetical protein MHM83_00655 [Tenacibaculum sp. Mcav3-52]|uniref:hypothetical protein n=1 Tax=Tenacibaculum sp. Mcav3-52 TaxID=2917762 RepID=UPI001EF187A2|nr:hypothetical protein [Tenacibaculum sp. Mcav3-52]MCG7500372.1 hypothetical protein [Tenacibaculum sp. Mcav3-52]
MKSKYKHFYNKAPIEFIQKFEKGYSGDLKSRSSYLNNLKNVDLKLENDEVVLDFKTINKKAKKSIVWNDRVFRDVTFKIPKYDFFVEKLYCWSWDYSGFTNLIYTKGFKNDKRKYFKFIIPLKKRIDFHYQLERLNFKSEYVSWSRNASSINLEDEDIYILQEKVKLKGEDYYYLIIESNKKQLFSEFNKKVFSVRVALGYITGDFRGNKAYVFSYRNKKRNKIVGVLYQTLRKDMKSFYQPVNSNPYAWLHSVQNRKKAKSIYNKHELRTLTQTEFSSLFKVCFNNDRFLGILLLMIETGKNSLLISPITYFVALEQFSGIVIKDKPIPPIKDKKDFKYLKTGLQNVVIKYENTRIKKDDDLSPIKNRIDNLNQGTNNDKLKSCFNKLNINLLSSDREVIKARNIFLHGDIPNYRKKKNRSINDKDLDMYYTSIRIYTLLNMLILKYVGYDNYVINFPKIYEKNTGYVVNEDYYRKV